MAAVDVGQDRNDVLRHGAGAAVLRHARQAHRGGERVLEGAEVYVEAEVFGARLEDEVHIIVHILALQAGGHVQLGAHAHVAVLGQGQGHPDDLPPVLHRGVHRINDAHLGAQDGEPQLVGKLDVPRELLIGFLGSQLPADLVVVMGEEAGVDPVAVLHGDDLILVQQLEPLVKPGLRGIGIAFDVAVCQDLQAVGAHVVHVGEAVLQGHGPAVLAGVAIDGYAPLGSRVIFCIHACLLLSELFCWKQDNTEAPTCQHIYSKK